MKSCAAISAFDGAVPSETGRSGTPVAVSRPPLAGRRVDGVLARRGQLDTRTLGKRLRPHEDEHVARRAQFLARLTSPALTPQPFPVDEMRTREVRCRSAATQVVDRST